jgi:hypothetical protein
VKNASLQTKYDKLYLLTDKSLIEDVFVTLCSVNKVITKPGDV